MLGPLTLDTIVCPPEGGLQFSCCQRVSHTTQADLSRFGQGENGSTSVTEICLCVVCLKQKHFSRNTGKVDLKYLQMSVSVSALVSDASHHIILYFS